MTPMADFDFFQGLAARAGRVMCMLCFEFVEKVDCEPCSDEPGKVWDVCKECAAREKANGATY